MPLFMASLLNVCLHLVFVVHIAVLLVPSVFLEDKKKMPLGFDDERNGEKCER